MDDMSDMGDTRDMVDMCDMGYNCIKCEIGDWGDICWYDNFLLL